MRSRSRRAASLGGTALGGATLTGVSSGGTTGTPISLPVGWTVTSGYLVGPINLTGAFITGGFFSLDGFHLTDMGYTLFADEFIKAINTGYGTSIPLAGLWQFRRQP